MMNAIESAKAANKFFEEMFGDLPEEGQTNRDIMGLIQLELKMRMRKDITVEFHKTRTGINASFKADMGINRFGTREYAHITTKAFHRIQRPSDIVGHLRRDHRLYDTEVTA